MIEFYLDSYSPGNLIDPDNIAELSKEAILFDDSFKLGSTPCLCMKLNVLKGAVSDFDYILVYENNTLIATLQLDSVDTENDVFDSYTLVDKMVNFNVKYDGSSLSGSTLLDIAKDICTTCDSELDSNSENFLGNDKVITWYDSTISAREYISYIAELNGGFAYITADGKLAFKQFTTNNSIVDTISVEECGAFKLGEQHKIIRVLYDNGVVVYQQASAETDGDTLYLNGNNVYITSQSDIDNIYNLIQGFSFYSLVADKCPIGSAVVGDLIQFTLNGNTYTTIAQIEQSYGLGWLGGYSCDLANAFEEETKVIDPVTQIRTVKTQIDRELGEIRLEVSDFQQEVNGLISGQNTLIQQNSSEINLVSQRTTNNTTKTNRIRITDDETQFLNVSVEDLGANEPSDYVGISYQKVSLYVDGAPKVSIKSDGINAPTYNVGDWKITTTNSGNTLVFDKKE